MAVVVVIVGCGDEKEGLCLREKDWGEIAIPSTSGMEAAWLIVMTGV